MINWREKKAVNEVVLPKQHKYRARGALKTRFSLTGYVEIRTLYVPRIVNRIVYYTIMLTGINAAIAPNLLAKHSKARE